MNNENSLVAIEVITYNHGKYIRNCLDGIIMQKTNFPFEVLINDDASTDETAEIIKEYEQKYPNIIKSIYQHENQFSKGLSISKNFIYPRVKSKYFAVCEGDDYWTDPYKLQKQVDFLEANPEYSICFHDARVIHEPKVKEDYIYPSDEVKEQCSDFDFENLLNINFIPTCSVVYRVESYPDFLKDYPDNIMPGDWYLHLLFASKGKIKYIPEVMSVYRRQPNGIWYGTCNNYKKHVCRYCIKETHMRYQVYKNITNNKKKYFMESLLPFFIEQQCYILSDKNIRLWFTYNFVHYRIYLLCFKYWYCMPGKFFDFINRLLKNIKFLSKNNIIYFLILHLLMYSIYN